MRYLNEHTIIDTRQFDEMRAILVGVYDARSFIRLDNGPFSAQACYFGLGFSSLSYCGYENPVRIEFREADTFRFQFGICGSGRTWRGQESTDIHSGVIVTTPTKANFEFGPSFGQLSLRVDRAALQRDVTTLLGTRPAGDIFFDLSVDNSAGQTKRLREYIFYTASSIDTTDEPIPAPLLKEMDEAIRLAVLFGVPNNFSRHLAADPKDATPWQVRRVEEWIDAHWKEGVTIEKLAEVSGAGVRSIFASFRSARGYTPMAYLKKVRLNAARDILLRAEPGVTVTGVAFACQFLNPGHFAKDYQMQFGERPSETLRRARLYAP